MIADAAFGRPLVPVPGVFSALVFSSKKGASLTAAESRFEKVEELAALAGSSMAADETEAGVLVTELILRFTEGGKLVWCFPPFFEDRGGSDPSFVDPWAGGKGTLRLGAL